MIRIKNFSKKKLIIIVAALVLITSAGGLFYYFRYYKNDNNNQVADQNEPVNLDPPTEEDAQRVEDNKQEIIDRDKQLEGQSQPSSGQQTANPTIVYAGLYGQTVEVSAQVSVFETSGTCTASFSQGNAKITRSVQAIQNVNRMSCPTISVPAAEFIPKGDWSVVVTYSSASAFGTSNSTTIRVE